MFCKHGDESGRLDYTWAAFAPNETMTSVNVPFDQRILYMYTSLCLVLLYHLLLHCPACRNCYQCYP